MKKSLKEFALLAEIISAVAIFISLVYVGIQVGDNASAVRSAAVNDANAAWF